MASYQRQNKRNDIGKPKKKGREIERKKLKKKSKQMKPKLERLNNFFSTRT